ncbi:MAG: hypothetical protein Q8N21_04270 [bacterium]|nr:hypothetical protein [bacterium]
MNFETPPQNHPDVIKSQVDKNILAQKEADMRDLFRSSDSPLDVIIAEMQTDEFKNLAGEAIANKTIDQLRGITYKDEDDFVTRVMAVAMPVLEITQKGKKDAYKQEGRDMYTEADVETAVSIIKESGAEKIYIIGNVGSGKTTFSREVSRETGFKNIDVDRWFQIFRQEQQREATDLSELLKYILQKEKPPFVINHADLLRQNLIKDADMVVYLNPKKGELLKSRRLRSESGAEGEWQTVSEGEYDKIAKENTESFENMKGVLKHYNEKSGTSIRVLKTNE